MTEGITTLLELDYTNRALSGLERDRALGKRLNEFQLVLDYRFPQAMDLPLKVDDTLKLPTDAYVYDAWGYFKGASTLDLLRLRMGEAAFDDALKAYLAACDVGPCSSDTFRAKVGDDAFFSEWVDTARRHTLTITFEPDGAVTLDQGQPGYLPIELWLEQADGSIERQPWLLTEGYETKHFAVARRVRVNPRHEAIVRVDPKMPGDVDFDGEVDGFDVIACSRLVGHALSGGADTGVWGIDLDFDRRCDRDHDGQITAADVAALPFNSLRSSP